MDKRIFPIDEKCFIIYTGKSSSDNNAFLRIGNSDFVTKDIQPHIRYIVVNDAVNINIKKEKENIRYMERGKISYICNKINHDILFKALSGEGVDTENLYHQDLSKELDNISRIENKKHFFTIFYENKNIKLVFNEDVIFDLFESETKVWDYPSERIRLANLMKALDDLHNQNKKIKLPADFIEDDLPLIELDYDSSMIFLIQDNLYVPLGVGMFNIKRKNKNCEFDLNLNASQRFYVGKEISLVVLEKGAKKISLKGRLTEGEVIESEVLYKYKIDCSSNKAEDSFLVLRLYKYLLDKAKAK